MTHVVLDPPPGQLHGIVQKVPELAQLPDSVIDRPLTAPASPLSVEDLHAATKRALDFFLATAGANQHDALDYTVDEETNVVTATLYVYGNGFYEVQRLQNGSYKVSHAPPGYGTEAGSYFIQVNSNGSITQPQTFGLATIDTIRARQIIEDALHAIQNSNN